MALYAVDDIRDAFDATREFLLPADPGRWLRLAVIAFFVGGTGVGGGSPGGGGGGSGTDVPVSGGFPELSTTVLLAIAVLAAVLVLLGLAFAVVGSIMEFVLVESLRRDAVHLRSTATEHWRKGLRLFAFRLLFGLALIGVTVGVGALLVLLLGGLPALTSPRTLVGLALVGIPFVAVVAVVGTIVSGFTTVFVVPIMLLEDRGVLAGWRRLLPTIRREPRQYLAYIVLTFVLHVAAGVLVGVVLGVVGAVFFLPLVAVGLGSLFAGGPLSIAIMTGLAVIAAALLLVFLAVAALVQVPVITFFRFYALLVLGDIEPELDLIADRRDSLRSTS